MAKQLQHEDFGEKIGGAKKDLWQERGLLSVDLAAMNEREADKYVKKDNIWKKPDYGAMIDGGMPVDVAFYIKTARDSGWCFSIDDTYGNTFYKSEPTPERSAKEQERPSALDKLSAAKDAVAKSGAEKAAPDKAKEKSGNAEL